MCIRVLCLEKTPPNKKKIIYVENIYRELYNMVISTYSD